MRIVVVIPSEDWRNTAGVRIRYDRIRPPLKALGHSFTLVPIDAAMVAPRPEGDVYLISKCHDIRSVLLARRLRAAGCAVGIDVFDDYYSQRADAAFVHLRAWFRAMAGSVDFALCSTPNMRDRLASLAPALPLFILNDPASGWDAGRVGAAFAATLERTLATRVLDIGWFGIGDNPYFPLGLEDLQAFSGMLLRCRARGFQPRLRILTNRRALDARRLEMIARLPVPALLDEWSDAAEAALIADSLMCFLPVNGQEFSTVKSLNRAVSVLAGGSQVLSAGFPLYASLAPFIYRDLGEMLEDLGARRLRVRAATLPDLGALMARLGSAEGEAGRLASFLEGLPRPAPRDWPGARPVLVMHGNRSLGDIHKQVQKSGYLSVGSPRTTARLNFDVTPRFDPEGAFVDIALRPRAVAKLAATWRARLTEEVPAGGGDPVPMLRLTRADLPGLRPVRPLSAPPLVLEEVSRYPGDMALMGDLLRLLFEDPELYLSETNAPYAVPDPATAGASGGASGGASRREAADV